MGTQFLRPFRFPFPIIPGNNNVSFPFPKVGNGICHSRSHSQKLGMEFVIPVPIPKSWESYFSFPFPFPKLGNGLSNSRFCSQSQKTIPAHPWALAVRLLKKTIKRKKKKKKKKKKKS